MTEKTEPDFTPRPATKRQEAKETSHRKVNPNHTSGKKIFTMKMLRHWNKLPREVMESQNSTLSKMPSNLL